MFASRSLYTEDQNVSGCYMSSRTIYGGSDGPGGSVRFMVEAMMPSILYVSLTRPESDGSLAIAVTIVEMKAGSSIRRKKASKQT